MANNSAAAVVPARKKNFFDIFCEGARKGVNIWLNTVLPSATLCYTIMNILTLIGFNDLMAKLFDPVMGLFGLPGEAMISIMAGFLSKSNGCAMAASLFAEGILTAQDVTVLLVTNFVWGGMMPQWPRTLAASGCEGHMHVPMLALMPIGGVVAMFLCNLIF